MQAISDTRSIAPEWQARFEALPADPLRAQAFRCFAETGLPHRRMEAWRWTDMQTPPRANSSRRCVHDTSVSNTPVAQCSGAVFHFRDGRLILPDILPEGVRLTEITDSPAPPTPMAALAVALAESRPGLEITGQLSEPLIFRFETAGFAHIGITLADGASAHIIESHIVPDSADLTSIYAQLNLGDGARLSRSVFQAGNSGGRQASCVYFHAGKHASYTQTALACGAGLSRLETRGVMAGEKAQCVLNAAYIAGPDRHADLTSHIRFAAPDCSARQTLRGIAAEKGRGVFQGKFEVTPIAQKTDAAMHHAAMLLSGSAEINARPELEIYADDVACAHGNAIGTLDEAVIFYMRQRGLNKNEARHVLASGFAKEALLTLSDEAVREYFLSEAEAWLMTCL